MEQVQSDALRVSSRSRLLEINRSFRRLTCDAVRTIHLQRLYRATSSIFSVSWLPSLRAPGRIRLILTSCRRPGSHRQVESASVPHHQREGQRRDMHTTLYRRTVSLRLASESDHNLTHGFLCRPYEDIAFTIVNKGWERSHKRGFR